MMVWRKVKMKVKMFFLFLFLVATMFFAFIFTVAWIARQSEQPPPMANIGRTEMTDLMQNEEREGEKVRETQKESAMINAPILFQNPELPSGCEITSLTMLLNYYGIQKDKMEMVREMPLDKTPLQTNAQGRIVYWGNPNTGFVGEVTGKGKGYGIYHAPLFQLLKKYIPTAEDLTGSSFDELERKVSRDIPVLVWTTIDYKVPEIWMEWDSPTGPVKATFMEHAALMVGYDKDFVYVNDPLSGRKKIPKKQFIEVWEAMGKQALSYTI